MPRYFFHVVNGTEVHRDCVGEDHPSDSDAVKEARLVAGELVRDAAFGDRSLDHILEVSDASGKVVISFRCSDVFRGD